MSARAAGAAAFAALAGCGDPPPPTPAPWFEELAAESGIDFEHVTGRRPGRWLMPESLGGGAALLDADGDGRLDVYLVQSGRIDEPGGDEGRNRLFLQRPAADGELRFEDATEASGAGDRGYGMGATAGDVDGDGRADLVVTNLGPNALLLARGGGRFEDATARWGAGHPGWGTSAALCDLDSDGDLDLYVANYVAWTIASEIECRNERGERDYCPPANYAAPEADLLLENDGGRAFRDVSEASGVARVRRYGLGVGCADFDADGLLDVFVANDGQPNTLWRNRGGLRFEDVGARAGCAVDSTGRAKAGMGVAIGDADGDGDEDLLVCNIAGEGDSFFENRARLFVDRTRAAGLALASRPFTRFGVGLVDLDCDGRLDLYQANGRVNRGEIAFGPDPYAEPDLVLRGLDGPRWEEVLPRGGTLARLLGSSRGAAFGDLDDDGGIDVLVVDEDGPARLLRNAVPGRGRWIGFRLVDPRGADALHARVTCRAGERILSGTARAAYSYLASNDPRVHLGLGSAGGVQDVVVRWPDGAEERFGDLPAGRYHVLRRGGGRPRRSRHRARGRSRRLSEDSPEHPREASVSTAPLPAGGGRAQPSRYPMHGAPLFSACLLAVLAAPGAAQSSDSSAASEQVIAVSRATSGESEGDERHYRRVVRDGVVVEESGDRSLMDELEIGKLLEEIRFDEVAHADANERASSRADSQADSQADSGARADARAEASAGEGELPRDLRKLVEDLGGDGAARTVERRVVVENGEVVVDEELVDGAPARRDRRGRGLPEHGSAGERPARLERALEGSRGAGGTCACCDDCPLLGSGSRLDALIEELGGGSLDRALPRGAAPRAFRGALPGRPVRAGAPRLDPFEQGGPLLDLGRTWDIDAGAELRRLEHLIQQADGKLRTSA